MRKKKIVVTYKSYVNPSSTMDAVLTWEEDGRKLVVPAMTISKRVRIFDGVLPTTKWVKRKTNGNG